MKLIAFVATTAFFSFQAVANMWGLCPGTPVTGMIPCDTACFGKAAIDLGINVAKSESELQSEFVNTSKKWADLNSTFVDVLSNYADLKTSTHLDYIKALNGLSYKIAGSLEQSAQIEEKNVEHLVTSYKTFLNESLLTEQVVSTSLDYGVQTDGLKGTELVLNQPQIANSLSHQDNKNRISVVLDDQRGRLTEEEVANYVITDLDSEEEITLKNIGPLLAEDSLTLETWNKISLKLSALYSRTAGNHADEIRNIRAKFAINALLDSIVLDDENGQAFYLSQKITEINIREDLKGGVKMSPKRVLNEELNYTQALSNSLLNELLLLKRDRNALSAAHYSSGY